MAGRPKKMLLFAPAKLNLGLWVVGRRHDGYHLLESLFWPIDLGDDIELEWNAAAPGVSMEWAADAPIRLPLPAETENIVARIRQKFPSVISDNMAIRIRKRVPMGGGLGGGSSDAGTLLSYLAPDGTLDERAAELGADVPFFLNPRPTWVTGVGEKRRILKFSAEARNSIYFLVVCLPKPTPTPAVFRALKESRFVFSGTSNPFPTPAVSRAALENYLGWARNDLEPFAAEGYPLIGEVISELRKTPCSFAGMSGSGSTCFAVYRDALTREKSAKELSAFFRERGCTGLFVGTHKAHR